MSYTAEDLIAIELAIKSGTRVVKYSDKVVEYRSLEELERIRQLILDEIGSSPRRETKRVLTEFKKGVY